MDITSNSICFSVCQTKTGGYGLLVHSSKTDESKFSAIKTHPICIVNPRSDINWISPEVMDILLDFSTKEEQYIANTDEVITAPNLFGAKRPKVNGKTYNPSSISQVDADTIVDIVRASIGDPVLFNDSCESNLYDLLDQLKGLTFSEDNAMKFVDCLYKALGASYDVNGEVTDDERKKYSEILSPELN